jgi:hypothetical protein
MWTFPSNEKGKKGGNRPGKGATQGQPGGASRDSLAAGEDADTEYGDGEGAEAACSGARSHGAAPLQSAGTCYARQEPGHWWYRGDRTSGVRRDVASGAAGGFVGRQSVTPVPMTELLVPAKLRRFDSKLV